MAYEVPTLNRDPCGARTRAAILIGGHSRRMGKDKARLIIDGSSMLERCVETLRKIVPEVIVVGAQHSGESIHCARFVSDLFPGQGPVGGIITALSALGRGSHLVVACDMPFLQISILNLLVAHDNGDDDAVIPLPSTGPEPLCALYRDTAVPKLERYLEGGGRALYKALERLRTHFIPEHELRSVDPDLVSFTNVNTPEDFDLARSRVRQ